MIQQALVAGYSNHLRVVDAADFDGTNDYLSRGADLTGAADSKSGIISAWLRFDAGLAQQFILDNAATAATRFFFYRTSTNVFAVSGRTSAGTVILSLSSTTAYANGATWRHVLISWDLATAAGHLYVNDAEDLFVTKTLTDNTLEYTTGAFHVGASPNASAGDEMDGCMAEVYFAPGQYLDFSNVYNRRKFISATGKPVHLGTDGSLPTGIAPLLYLHLDDAEAAANFATNRGTGGDLTITGTLDAASTSPSD
jgi:hypothetical protein